MRELVIISGKGGTGKTTLTACFAYLARNNVLADCDVDAADLHILAHPEIVHEEDFRGGVKARIDRHKCVRCGLCREACRFGAISDDMVVSELFCEGCSVCFHICPEEAVVLEEAWNGRWFISNTRFGPMVHAELFPGKENSGRLVSLVRNQARVLAKQQEKSLILVDGAPGIGCPVISSVAGADHVLVVAEPSQSGLHDMERVLKLVEGFGIQASVVVNKSDINPEVAQQVEDSCVRAGARFVGRIPYDSTVVSALVRTEVPVENGNGPASTAIREIWQRLEYGLFGHGGK